MHRIKVMGYSLCISIASFLGMMQTVAQPVIPEWQKEVCLRFEKPREELTRLKQEMASVNEFSRIELQNKYRQTSKRLVDEFNAWMWGNLDLKNAVGTVVRIQKAAGIGMDISLRCRGVQVILAVFFQNPDLNYWYTDMRPMMSVLSTLNEGSHVKVDGLVKQKIAVPGREGSFGNFWLDQDEIRFEYKLTGIEKLN